MNHEIMRALRHVQARSENVAMEALQDIFHRLPFGQKIVLSNGKSATIKPFFEPMIAQQGEERSVCCGLDVQFDDGSGHIEFTINLSGWGGVP